MVLNRKGFFLELGEPDPAVAAKYAEANAARTKAAAKGEQEIIDCFRDRGACSSRQSPTSTGPNQHRGQTIADNGGSHCSRTRGCRGLQAHS